MLDQGNSQVSSVVTSVKNSPVKNSVGHMSGPDLRGNEFLQTEVDKRLAELEKLNETATRGRLKSQRGGLGNFLVKRMVDWPQNFILTSWQS